MEKPTKRTIKFILNQLSVQQKVQHAPLQIEKTMDTKVKKLLSPQGLELLSREVNTIMERQKVNLKSKTKLLEQEDFNRMKRNLKIYGKNKKDYRVEKIIRFDKQPPQPLKNIVKVHENKFTIAKEYNIKLSQKIDSIIQEQKIVQLRNQKREHLQNKLQSPLIKELKRYNSTHTFNWTDRDDSMETQKPKGRSIWTQRAVCFEGCKLEQKSMEKYKRSKVQRPDTANNIQLRKQRYSLESPINDQKQNFFYFDEGICVQRIQPSRRLKRKAMEFN